MLMSRRNFVAMAGLAVARVPAWAETSEDGFQLLRAEKLFGRRFGKGRYCTHQNRDTCKGTQKV